MSRPTEPGYYWLHTNNWKPEPGWTIVEVAKDLDGGLAIYYIGCDYPFSLTGVGSDQWGGKITQEPAPDPPPPF